VGPPSLQGKAPEWAATLRAVPEPVRDLATLLARLEPRLAGEPYVFVSRGRAGREELEAALGSFREVEGVTLILELEAASRLGLEGLGGEGRWALITLGVHSSLAAVGLLARVAGALAEAGISCNPVSARHHDHLFVPWEERERALGVLTALSLATS
jgi:hypothetical protein